MSPVEEFSPIRWERNRLLLLDQTLLPAEERWLECTEPSEVAAAIRRLAVRGAPAIGVAAAYGLVLGIGSEPASEPANEPGSESASGRDEQQLRARFAEVVELLGDTRPTAVNLRWALELGRQVFEQAMAAGAGPSGAAPAAVRSALLDWARRLQAEDVATNRRIGEHGARLFASGDRVLTHCNAGALATAGYGTALGVIQSSWRQGRVGMVWVDETRPLLQGARLTAWELGRLGIPHRVVTDSSAGTLLARGLVDRIVVGADRIAANGDTANKIGTYAVAVLAHRHGVPFYVAAPRSTIDPATPTGADIPIEERDPDEVTRFGGVAVTPPGAAAANFAFDVTPAELIAGLVTEIGVLAPPYGESIRRALAAG